MNPVMDGDFVKWFATLGVGGVLAGFMFVFYRKDVRSYTDLWKLAADQMMKLVQDNTAALTKLITMLESQERNSIRKDDIKDLIDKKISESK